MLSMVGIPSPQKEIRRSVPFKLTMIATQNNRYIDLFLEYIFVEKVPAVIQFWPIKADLNLFKSF